MRINKFLSETGITSRRGADKFIEAGRVLINGQKAELGSKVDYGDEVHVDGKLIQQPERAYVYLVLNKPIGITSTTERHIDGNIVDFINHPERIFHVGRLDKDSEGLILMTNDGDIVNEILRAENEHEKEYIVTVDKPVTDEFLENMANGVEILDTVTLPAKAEKIAQQVFKLTINQGLNRQIRRMCTALGYEVRRLQRIRVMNLRLGNLKVGEWRNLTEDEKHELFQQLSYQPKR
ncbi:23S rRNA pseudouridine(2604) synthase RluF [Planococcus sp. ISL-109]|uniref:23S rRNA pseudouridine(2604) synthase RluF n=1 Tax=Planococcus sp. ISL-109 TaxID=2819166 RepID=UPI001BE6E898|nr:23S rRNA pseudouridine(2604) synthase RluF [Planococcus sp. ISL-109]MBT2582739.1 23S rRNA pseudouridine(2604) synthase RluF [Planococcus sp. ISL-109]